MEEVEEEEYEASAEEEDEIIAQYYKQQEYPQEEPVEEEEEGIFSSGEDITEMLSELEDLVIEEQDRSRDFTPREELSGDTVVLEESLVEQEIVQEIGEEQQQDAAAEEYLRSLGLD